MEFPSPLQEPGQICPKCKKPVPPGYKFCESCGTRVAGPFTCSHCGTQFFSPVTHCDLCGARIIAGVSVPEQEGPSEPDDTYPEETGAGESAELSGGDPAGQEETGSSGADPPVPEPGPGRILHRHYPEIQEPDTDELLEKFGDDEDEGSFPPRGPRSLQNPRLTKPSPGPATSHAGSEVSDDALFLIGDQSKQKTPPPGRIPGKKWVAAGAIILIVTLIILSVFWLPVFTGRSGPDLPEWTDSGENTTLQGNIPVSATVSVRTTTPVPVTSPVSSLVTLPTQGMPAGQKVYFFVDKNPVTAKISVIFTGSAGEGSISSADVTVTHPGGAIATGVILPLKGVNEITLSGSRGADRVEIIVTMSSGDKYRVYDALVPYRGD